MVNRVNIPIKYSFHQDCLLTIHINSGPIVYDALLVNRFDRQPARITRDMGCIYGETFTWVGRTSLVGCR